MATNNLSAQSVVLDLLRYIGVTGFGDVDNDQALNQPGVDDDDIRRAIAAINSGLQTIQKWGPAALRSKEKSAFFHAPGSLTVSVTNGSTTATASSPPSAWMNGCSILIDGDADLNRIMVISGSTLTLLRAYLGTTNGAAAATVYSDCASLEANIESIAEPVSLTPNLRLYPARDLDDFERYRSRWWSAMFFGDYSLAIYSVSRNPGVPVRYIVEPRIGDSPFLRVTPMPASATNASFQAKLRAERITASVIGDAPTYTDPGYYFTSIHDDLVEGVLLPIARWRFFTHPALKNAESGARVKAEYDEVMTTLKHGQTFTPSVKANRARYI